MKQHVPSAENAGKRPHAGKLGRALIQLVKHDKVFMAEAFLRGTVFVGTDADLPLLHNLFDATWTPSYTWKPTVFTPIPILEWDGRSSHPCTPRSHPSLSFLLVLNALRLSDRSRHTHAPIPEPYRSGGCTVIACCEAVGVFDVHFACKLSGDTTVKKGTEIYRKDGNILHCWWSKQLIKCRNKSFRKSESSASSDSQREPDVAKADSASSDESPRESDSESTVQASDPPQPITEPAAAEPAEPAVAEPILEPAPAVAGSEPAPLTPVLNPEAGEGEASEAGSPGSSYSYSYSKSSYSDSSNSPPANRRTLPPWAAVPCSSIRPIVAASMRGMLPSLPSPPIDVTRQFAAPKGICCF